jgi:hypothetical protein
MYQQGVRAGVDRRLDQGLAGGHSADDVLHLRIRLDLQSVRTIVIKFIDFQVLVAEFAKLF